MKKMLFALTAFLLFSAPLIASQQADAQKQETVSPQQAEANRLNAEAVKLYNEKRHDEALPLAKRALELREKELGREHELVATAMISLAGIYLAKAKYGEAESLYKRALAVLEKKFGPHSLRLASTLDHLALVNFAQGNNGKSEELFKRSLAIREKALSPTHRETGIPLNYLGQFYERTGKYDKAAEFYKRTLEVKEKALGPDHRELAELLDKCACALALSDKPDEAKQYKQRAEAIRQSAPQVVRKPGGVLAGEAIYRVEPYYPSHARQERISGAVIVQVTIDECGIVIDASALLGPAELRQAALQAARKWRFKLGQTHYKYNAQSN